MDDADLNFQGMDTLVGVIHQASPRATQFLGESMDTVGEQVFKESQVQVPVRHGILKASGHLDPVDFDGAGQLVLSIGYGGASAEYALFVHENLLAQHRSPTKAKFLEDPMNDALGKLTRRLQGRMEGALMGQYPQAPAKGVTNEARADIGAVGSTASQIARSPALSATQVTQALQRLSGGS